MSASDLPGAAHPDGTLVRSVRRAARHGVDTVTIEPGPGARADADPEAVWAEVVRRLAVGRSGTLHDQLVCHVLFAADKRVWHLEPGRPDVGLVATIAARCNPGAIVDPDVEGGLSGR